MNPMPFDPAAVSSVLGGVSRLFPKPSNNPEENVVRSLGKAIAKEYLYNPETKKVAPQSLLHNVKDISNTQKSFSVGKISKDQFQQSTIDSTMPFVMGMTQPARGAYLVNEDAQIIPKLANKFDKMGNISIDETDKVLNLASKYLQIPKQVMSKMSTKEIIAELGGLMTPNQSYVFKQLPGL